MQDKDKKSTETEILEYWQKNKIFEQTLAKTKKGKPFVFYEGPPTANGKPGIHHVEGRSFKDVILRYKTMRGFRVPRVAGWDTHGLPVEVEVEKELGLKSKKEIEEYGIEAFNKKCRESVWKYKKLWEDMTARMGFWIDMDKPYVTYENSYMEKLWGVIKNFSVRKLLYKDYKVVPWCPRCGTSLSSHELAQGYKKIKEKSIYIKFKAKDKAGGVFYFLVWTTTPWTLPGNVALAVNPKATYVVAEKDGARFVLVKERAGVLEENYKIISERSGQSFLGVEYEPLYRTSGSELPIFNYKVIGANFVSTEDGTGIVHIAPAFGADDQKVGKENGLTTLITTAENGKMLTPDYLWNGKYFQEANQFIVQNLKERNLFLKEESHEHDYPFCWRCDSALMYLAKNSWFLKTTAVKKEMLAENKKIGWHPEFIKDGRFGQWLKENVDWAISRERYWGVPLPVWICEKCGHQEVVGSINDLDKLGPKRTTRVFVVRHGEAEHNVKGIVGPAIPARDFDNHLTKKGIKEAEKTARALKKEKIDLIISSPLNRTRQTSEILASTLGVKMEVNEQIYDYNIGDFHDRSIKDSHIEFPFERRLCEPFPNGESLRDVRARMMMELRRIVRSNSGKNILIVSHGDPMWVLNASLEGLEEKNYPKSWYPKTGEAKELKLHNWPYNRDGELDLHKPYADLVNLRCQKCEGNMSRVKEIADVWFDSGAMPFASDVPGYPADYIVEAVDQTRGWFYTLLAVASLLGKKAPYKNVISYGHVLDSEGKKMSKHKGNVVEPSLLFDKYGADAVRWYFYTVNQPWDEKLFKESDIAEASRRFLNIFRNSFVYWQTYKDKSKISKKKPKLLINKWLNARMNQVGYEATEALEKYDIVKAARAIENFVAEDLSRWYIRRIRDAIRFGSKKEKEEISSIFGLALYEVAKLSAPFVPFLTDKMFLDVMGKGSIHLEKWTKFKKPSKADKKLAEEMNEARRIVSLALEARAKAGIKVRQPLALLKVKSKKLNIKNKELVGLIKGEVNIKEIKFDPKIKDEVELDVNITPELKEEGQLRELIRHIQEKRKEAGLQPSDKTTFVALTDDKGETFVKKFESVLKKEAGIKVISFGEPSKPNRLTISLKFGI
ncbi:MAG: hypothetical protein A2931_03625 [Candidatus Niyogibacteria bacterium RIFCSPLOWO2_01_FULL_45_48]|uniref:isoleucine--tRNA ligase n=2 Tax=Candidatus Niyogiibacteriota TaxID=1817912 RepID=A0A1G2EXE4_9BACT|nr:MAG: hypothetical protein A2835_01405 [Candidatus Niyogibacteria bacterium RIFCSPHIGHO2_01_FULL_45_28]OGZ30172.1 MAG: hypothetical protein A3J00_00700 [Candidatus Niyogibacteria bacterium RIFCSPLOWO2_02_FULL_45_13]OGZ30918.1 MAG: hypothetical protein A2931_03625 [Candidatus Niyogibacteria bacterium RIFCSPLOWO2_01_FULL_45_48]